MSTVRQLAELELEKIQYAPRLCLAPIRRKNLRLIDLACRSRSLAWLGNSLIISNNFLIAFLLLFSFFFLLIIRRFPYLHNSLCLVIIKIIIRRTEYEACKLHGKSTSEVKLWQSNSLMIAFETFKMLCFLKTKFWISIAYSQLRDLPNSRFSGL